MWLKTIINFISLIAIAILSSILGGEYSNPLHLLLIGSLIIASIVIQILLTQNNIQSSELKSIQGELNQSNFKLSDMLLHTNSHGINRLCLTIHPVGGGVLTVSQSISFIIIMNAPFEVLPTPDLKLITKSRWGTVCLGGTEIFPQKYGENLEYTFNNYIYTNLENSSNKSFSIIVDINFSTSGIHEYTLEARSREFQSSISNSFEII